MNRREFLQLRPLASEPSAAPTLLRFARRAMATNFEVILPFATPHATEAAEAALDSVDQLEDQLTIYREHSEVSRLNARAATEAVPVARNLFELLVLAAQLHQETAGAFDVSTGALIKAWGFHARHGRVPTTDQLAEALAKTGMQHISLDPAECGVSYLRPGLEINLGSIGKGFTLDHVVQMLWHDWQITSALVHGGHSSIFAIGSEPGEESGWPVAMSDPCNPEKSLGLFRLKDRALGTSSATYQHFLHEGRKLGHILDPRTGWPAEGMLAVTVTAPTAAVADALATAFFILGADEAQAYCKVHPDIGIVLVPDAANPRPVILGRACEEFRSSR